jgi:hypothetical protein
MFEGLILKLILSVFGQYIEIDKEDIKAGLFNGEFQIENVKIKQEVLGLLELPFIMKFGYVELLSLKLARKNPI